MVRALRRLKHAVHHREHLFAPAEVIEYAALDHAFERALVHLPQVDPLAEIFQ